MVQYNRIELLNHPVCKKYLAMKWCVSVIIASFSNLYLTRVWFGFESYFIFFPYRVAYGSKAHLLNMFLYLLGLLPLTHLIVTLRPTLNATSTEEPEILMVPISFRKVLAQQIAQRQY